MEYQDELHRPAFPYKFKFKFDGCPNCCVASIARADMSFIGTWRDDIKIDQEAVAAYMGGELPPNGGSHAGRDWGPFDIQKEVIDLCPTKCMWLEDGKLNIDDRECTRCMHCINVMPRALRIGNDRDVQSWQGQKHRSLTVLRWDPSLFLLLRWKSLMMKLKRQLLSLSGIGGWKKERTVNGSAS
jgi:sulfite reductase alpha subunit